MASLRRENLLPGSTSNIAIIQANTTNSIFSIPTLNDDIDEYHGAITVEVLPGTGYTVASEPDNIASLAVEDDDLPEISIGYESFIVNEGNPAVFRFESSTPPDNILPITISLAQVGQYLEETAESVTFEFPANQTTAIWELSTIRYNYNGLDGEITANIETGVDYKINQFSDSVTVSVIDIDVPVISLSYSGPSEIDEGTGIAVVANSSILSFADLSINYTVTQTGSFVEIPDSFEPVVLNADQSDVPISIQTIDDALFETDGEVTLQLMPGSGYTIDENDHSISVTILDNDKVTLAIDFADDENRVISEGTSDTLQYQITATPAVPEPGIMVNVEFTQEGESLPIDPDTNLPLASHQIRMLGSSLNEVVVITNAPIDDNIFSLNRTVTITLAAGEGYFVAEEPNNSITVSVLDDDAPQGISVLPVQSSISEAEDALFRVYSDSAVTNDLLINLRVTDGGDDFLGPNWPTNIVIPAGEIFAELTVPITDDEDAEQTGDVSVTILGGTGYSIATTNQTASISITDNDDLPIVAIAPVTENIDESQTAQFLITSSETLETFQSILVNVDETEDFILGNPADTVYIEANENSVIFEIELADDEVDEADGTIIVGIDPWINYQIDPTNNGENGSASVNVADNDETIVAIFPYYSRIDEGEPAEFEFLITPALPTAGLTLAVELIQVGEFITGSVESEVQISSISGGYSDAVTLASTHDDLEFEPNGLITATLLPRTGYTITSEPDNTATIEVLDNDTPNGISILAMSNSITEGESAVFQIRASERSDRTRTIYLDVQSGEGEFLSSTPNRWIDFAPRKWHQTLEFATIDDLIDETDHELIVRIIDASGYTVNSEYNQATIMVNDNDSPVVGVIAQSDVTEGEAIAFQIISTIVVAQDLPINLSWEHTGDFVDVDSLPEFVVIPAGERSVNVDIETLDDMLVEESGTLTARILTGQNYDPVAAEGRSVTSTILDNDILEVSVSVAEENAVITEGPDAQAIFTINISSAIPTGVLNIPYQLEFAGQPVSTEFKLSASQGHLSYSQSGEQEFIVDIDDDQEFESHGIITLTLGADQSYQLSESSNTASIKVLDDDSPVGISIIAVDSIVTKLAPAQFQIRSNRPVLRDQYIDVKLTDSGRFLQGARNRSVLLPSGQTAVNFDILLDESIHQESFGIITAILQPKSGYQIAESPSDTASITVLDEDSSDVVSIFPVDETIVEWGDAVFRVISSNPVPNDLEVFFRVSQVGDFIFVGGSYSIPESVVIAAGDISADLVIYTATDYVFEAPGAITVELINAEGDDLSNNTYTISKNPYNSATIRVLDDDKPAGISIIAAQSSIQEGETAQFHILSGRPFTTDREINVRVEKRGDFLSGTLPNSIKLSQFASSTILNIDTQDNGILNSDGSLSVSILPGENYTVARIPAHTTSMIVNDNTIPELSIHSIDESLNEGENIQFRVVSSIALPENLSVEVSLQYSNENQNINHTNIFMSAGETEGILTIETQDDSVLAPDIEVTATLLSGQGYTISDDSNHFATAIIEDNELPVVSITSNTPTAIEGESIELTIASQLTLKSNLLVNVSLTETGDFLTGNQVIEVELTPELRESVITIDLIEDAVNEAASNIVATIESASSYDIDPNNFSTTIIANDNDQPEISISTQESTVVEDSTATFEISANTTFYQDLTINLLSTATGDFLTDTLPTNIELNTESLTTDFEIQLDNDDSAEPDGMISITIAEGDGYLVATTPNDSVSIVIQDNDELPLDSIGITADVDSIDETRFIPLTLTASQASDDLREVNIRIGDAFPFNLETSFVYPVPFPASQLTHSFEFPVFDDQNFRPHARLYFGIEPGSGYSVSPISSLASIQVFDNDAPSGISVIQVGRVIEEGEVATFQIRSDQSVPFDRVIAVAVTLDDVLLTDPVIDSIVLPANESWTTLTIPTIDDAEDGTTKVLAVSIQASPVSPPEYEVTSVYSIAEVNVEDNDLSTYSISSNPNITEGDILEFTITATVTQNFDREIDIEVIDERSALTGIIPTSVTLPANASSVTELIITVDDTIDEPDNAITISIAESDDYQIVVGEESTEILVADNDVVAISLSSDATQIDEGGTVTFSIVQIPDTQSPVNVLLEAEGVSVSSQNLGTHQLNANDTLVVQTDRNQAYTGDGVISMTILPGAGYTVPNEPGNKIELPVVDLDIPTGFSILAASNNIEEGSTAKFKVRLNPTPTYQARINLNIDETGNMLASTKPYYVTFNQQSEVTFEVETIDDDQAESNSEISVTLSPVQTRSTSHSIVPDFKTASVIVTDNDTEQGISIFPFHNTVQEGDTIKFEIITSQPFSNSQTIPITINQIGDFLIGNLPNEVTLGASESSTLLVIETEDDNEYEINGGVTITLVAGDDYELGESFTSSVAIRDNEIVSGVSIRTLTNTITEGENISFLISSSESFVETNAIDLQINQVGDFLASEIPETVNFPAFLNRSVYEIGTIDDSLLELNGQVEISILPSPNYQVAQSPYNTTTISVRDNEPKPEISIENVSANSITEGESAQFQISISNPYYADLPILLNVSDGSNDYLTEQEYSPLILPANQNFVEVDIATEQDEVDEFHGTIYVTLLEGENYDIVSYPDNIASVNILDDDDPVISFEESSLSVSEGETVTLKLLASSSVLTDLNIPLEISENKEYIEEQDYTSITIPTGQSSGEIEIRTNENSTFSAVGRASMKILAGAGYRFTDDQESIQATLIIEDDENIPAGVSILSEYDTVAENHSGGSIRFNLYRDHTIPNDQIINLGVATTGSFITLNNTIQHTLPAGRLASTIEIPLIDDNQDEISGNVTLTVLPGTGYSPAQTPFNTASTAITDDDIPLLTMSLIGSDTIIEGNNTVIRFSVPAPVSEPLQIYLGLLEEGNTSGSNPNPTVQIESGSTFVDFTYTTIDDNVFESDGLTGIRILKNENYSIVRDSNAPTEIFVLDNDEPVTGLSIVNFEDWMFEGYLGAFHIRSSTPVQSDTVVNLQVTGPQLYRGNNFDSSVTIPAGESLGYYWVSSVVDEIYEADSEITAEILPSPDYQLANSNTTASIQILDDDYPTISITKNYDAIEGDSVSFRLDSSETILNSFSVSVSLVSTRQFWCFK